MSTAERPGFLDAMCEGNPTARQRLDSRLAAHDKPQPAPDKPVDAATTIKLDLADAPKEGRDEILGHYKLLEKVGEGGCGVVYVADQVEPVRRRVAIKVIKLGMDTKAVVARFEAERQALAMMDHPNIAKVLDAGTTEQGRPYFVMELVRGIKITEYCDENNLSTRDRLDLFIKICQAIQHAHQKGIIHRDIKPSNILVTLHDGSPVPKVIDFGIAKATDGRLTDATVYTQLHQFIGTPAYMSPEQAEMSGLDIDTRSDVYSLGVLLYELLVGSTPFDAGELIASGIDAMRKAIREKEPMRPSTKLAALPGKELTTTAKRRSVDAPRLVHQLQGDLDWIVMKCLEKDRTRRYETANGLAFDLKRHLNNEPVLARPPSLAYKVQKAVRRNKLMFGAASVVVIALVIGLGLATIGLRRAKEERNRAIAARADEQKQRQQAEKAQANEAQLRRDAEVRELRERQRAYASDMNVAQQALAANNFGRAVDLLSRYLPEPGQRDLRGWEWRYLWQQTRSDALFTLAQVNGLINSLTTSADGHWLAFGLLNKGGLWVWDLPARKQMAHLAENEQLIGAAFSPKEALLAFTSGVVLDNGQWKYTLHLWNVLTRQMVGEFPLDTACVGLAFSQDGGQLVTSTENGHITLWHLPDGTKLANYASEQWRTEGATDFAVSADLSHAAYVLNNNQLRLLDLRTGVELWTVVASKELVLSLAFSPDGKTLASGGGYSDSEIHLWNVSTGKQIGLLNGHGSWVGSLAFWPDGKKLASASADQTLRIWDLENQKCLDVLRGHGAEVWRLGLLPDNRTLVSGSKDGTVAIWDSSATHATQSPTARLEGILDWRFAPDSRSVLTLDWQGQVSRWTAPDFHQKTLLFEIGKPPDANQHFFVFSQDGRFLATGSTTGVLQVWDVSRGELRRQWTNTSDRVQPQAFLSKGSKLVTWSKANNLLTEWDLAGGAAIDFWKAPLQFSASGFSPDGRLCVAVGYGGDIILRNLAQGSSAKLDSQFLQVSGCGFSPDGTLVAMASELGIGRVWDAVSWKPKTTLGGFLLGTHSVAFSPDGTRLAVGGDDKQAIRLWDIASWQDVLTLDGEGSLFRKSNFSLDGNLLGSLSEDGNLHLWRALSREEIAAVEADQKDQSRQR